MTRSKLIKALAALAATLSFLPAQTANPKQPQLKGPKEQEAVMAMFQAPDPDARIAAANNLITKFADSQYKATALYLTAFSYQQKNDSENTIIFAEKCLEADPKFFGAQIMIASSLASRTKEFDLDKEEKLGRAEKMAKAALELIPTAPKPNPQLPDDQWEGAKKDFAAQAHESLGMIAMVRKKYDDCATEFNFSVTNAATPDPAVMLRLASCQIKVNKLDEALANVDKALADPNAVPQVKAAATQLKMDINKAKAGAK